MPAVPPIVAPAGFVYVATGERYLREAATAVAQLRRTNPGARVCLIADHAAGPAFWDDLVLFPDPTFSFRDKLAMRLCPYERFLYLDTDTHVVADLGEIFQLLDRFDFAGHQLFEGHDCPLPGIPDAFPEFNGGVLAFKRSPAVSAFFEAWLSNYDAFRALNRDGAAHYSNVSDQKSLRKTLYESSLQIAVLGPEFDFTPAHVDLACGPVRILHGRGDLAAFAPRLNAQLGNRVYHPTLDAVLHGQPSARELRRLWWRTGLQLLRAAGVACTPLALRNALRRSRRVRGAFLTGRFSP